MTTILHFYHTTSPKQKQSVFFKKTLGFFGFCLTFLDFGDKINQKFSKERENYLSCLQADKKFLSFFGRAKSIIETLSLLLFGVKTLSPLVQMVQG
jgi:hypothetical protein